MASLVTFSMVVDVAEVLTTVIGVVLTTDSNHSTMPATLSSMLKERKEMCMLFSDHNGSLLRRQPGAVHADAHSYFSTTAQVLYNKRPAAQFTGYSKLAEMCHSSA